MYISETSLHLTRIIVLLPNQSGNFRREEEGVERLEREDGKEIDYSKHTCIYICIIYAPNLHSWIAAFPAREHERARESMQCPL